MAILTVRDKNGNPIEIPALQGKSGKTAYQYAREGGYEGTENEFMELLARAANNSKVEVSYKQTLEGGIKIGHLIVDGVTTDICAPAAGESVGDGNDNQTIMGNGTAFGDNAAINLVGSGATTVTADKSNNTITIHTPEVIDTGDEVAWNQIQTGGTKIASININGTNTEVYVPSPDGVGDEVAITQHLASGTKIATININGTDTDIYAPVAGEYVGDGNTQFTTYIGTQNEKTNAATTNGNTYLKLAADDGAVKSQHKISGTGLVTVTSDGNGNMIINVNDEDVLDSNIAIDYTSDMEYAQSYIPLWIDRLAVSGRQTPKKLRGFSIMDQGTALNLHLGTSSKSGKVSLAQGEYSAVIAPSALTDFRLFTLPDASGTLALKEEVAATYETKQEVTNKLKDLSESIVSESKEWTISDESGNIIAKVDVDGLQTTQVSAKTIFVDGVEVRDRIPEVIDNLTSNSTTAALSAAQGKALKNAIDSITGDIGNLGGGDMMKASYDMNNNGIVDNAEKLEGHPASYFATEQDIDSIIDGETVVGVASEAVKAQRDSAGNIITDTYETKPFVIELNADETALANTTWVDIGSALYNGKVLELRCKDRKKYYRSCDYVYYNYDDSANILENELLFFVPWADHGNGYTFPGTKIIKITGSGVTVTTKTFDVSM